MGIARRQRRLFPELTYFDSEEAAKQALKRSVKHLWSSWRNRLLGAVGTIALGGLGVLAAAVSLVVFHRMLGLGAWVTFTLGMGVGTPVMALGLALATRIQAPVIRRCLRNELRAIGIPVCMRCGFDLRNTDGRKCPVCGNSPPNQDEKRDECCS